MSSGSIPTLIRYALSIIILLILLGASLLIQHYELAINLSIVVMAGLVAAAGYLRRGPALLMLALLWLISLTTNQVPDSGSLPTWILSQASVLGVFAFIVILVTSRRNNEQKLYRQSELFRTTLSSIGDGVIATDTNGCVTFINPEAERLTQCTGETAIGKRLPEVFTLVNEDASETNPNILDLLITKCSYSSDQDNVLLRGCDGSEIPVILSAAPIRDVDQTFLGAVIVFQDVTARRQSERAVLESEARLQQAQKIEAIGTLTGGIAHDFNNLLTAILGHTQLALRKLSPGDPIRKNLTEVEKA